MKLTDAQQVIQEVSGKQYSWLKAWGLSIIREAIRLDGIAAPILGR